MLAAVYSRTGPADVVLSLAEIPTPAPGPGEVRVRIAWSGVNPSDVKARSGLRTAVLPFPRIVPHSDGAGVIDRIGPGVPVDRLGQRVWIWNAAWKRPGGTAAQWAVVPESQAVPLPDGADLAVGACLGIPALTAAHAVALADGVEGRTVLVAGGAGAVGQYAIRMARLAGAKRVIASVSSEAKAQIARDAGADATVNYKDDDLVFQVLALTGGTGVDRVIEVDIAANAKADMLLLKPGGDIVVYGSSHEDVSLPFYPAIAKGACLRFFIVYELTPADRGRAVATVNGLSSGGTPRASHRGTPSPGADCRGTPDGRERPGHRAGPASRRMNGARSRRSGLPAVHQSDGSSGNSSENRSRSD